MIRTDEQPVASPPKEWGELNTQVQHDTNIAAQSLEGAAVRLNRLAGRLEANDDHRSTVIREFMRQMDTLADALKAAM